MMSIALFHGGARFTILVSQTWLWLLTQHFLFSLKDFSFPLLFFICHYLVNDLIFFLENLFFFFFCDPVRDPVRDLVRSDPGFVDATFVLIFTPSLTWASFLALLVGADCCSPPCSLCLLQSVWASARPWAYRKVEPHLSLVSGKLVSLQALCQIWLPYHVLQQDKELALCLLCVPSWTQNAASTINLWKQTK